MFSARSLLVYCSVFLVLSCKNSESWMARQWHNTVAHYNTYFNAREKVRLTEKELRERFADRFDGVLEIYNYGDENVLRNNGGAMDEVLKKTSNLVDQHPKSKWVDDAYMLMGESYFLRGDFFAARDLFQFVYSRFKDPDIKAKSQIGVFRCLYMTGKLDDAEGLISALSTDKSFPASQKYALDEARAALLIKREKYSLAVEPLQRLVANTRNRPRKARLHFILAQVLQRSGKNEQAVGHYARVLKLNPPYEMAFNAQINQVLCINAGQKSDLRHAKSLLRQMLKDDKNFDYRDQIYFRLGETEARDKNWNKAIEYYNLSLRNSTGNKNQMATTYLAMADYYFSKQAFEKSGYYYDSAVAVLPQESANYTAISQKSQMLGELVRYLLTIREQDSLLRLANDKPLLERTIDRLMAAERERQQQQEQQRNQPQPPAMPNMPGGDPMAGGGTAFPFYNAALRARGYNEFIRVWGQRENRDYWRLKNKRTGPGDDNRNTPGSGGDTVIAGTGIPGDVPADRRRYYANIPFTDAAKKEANDKIAQAMFGAGNVYREKLQDCRQANDMYSGFLNRFPKHELEPQVLFNMVKCYRSMNNTADATRYQNMLAEKHPGSTYLNVLRQQSGEIGRDSSRSDNPTAEAESDESELFYRTMYSAFRSGNYTEVIRLKKEADTRFGGSSLQANFEYLYALSLGYSGEVEKAILLLKAIASDFAGTEIAESAAATVLMWERRNGENKPPEPMPDNNPYSWNNNDDMFFLVIFNRGTDVNKVRTALSDHNSRHHKLKNLETGRPGVAGEHYIITVNGFDNKEALRGYYLQTKDDKEWKSQAGSSGEFFCCLISQKNYLELLKTGNATAYRQLFTASFK
jgi:tetratricopeptide (TPR) repeat protein